MQVFDPNTYCLDRGLLTVARSDALGAERRHILEKHIRGWNLLHGAMTLKEFAGVPVLVIDQDQVPKNLDGFEAYMMDRLPRKGPAAERLEAGFRYFEDDLHCVLALGLFSGFISPCVVRYPENAPPGATEAAIIIAPGKDSTPDGDLMQGDIKRPGRQALLPPGGNSSWPYFQLFHELAHVAGAKEPQADHIAGIFCRRAFPDTPTPWIQADIRALEAVISAVELATGKAACIEHHRMMLADYGWPMVTALDAANTLTAEEVNALTEEEILSRHQQDYPPKDGCLFQLGVLIRQAGLDGRILSGCTGEILRGARKLERRIASLTDDSELHHIAGRFALAARRIHGGAASYTNPVKPRLFTAQPR